MSCYRRVSKPTLYLTRLVYPVVLSLIPGSSSLLDDTRPWSHLQMTLDVGGMLNTYTHINHGIKGSIEHKLNKILFMFKIRSYCAIHKLLLDSHISLFPRHNLFLCPERNFGRHSNGTVRLPRFVSSAFPISIEVGIPNLV